MAYRLSKPSHPHTALLQGLLREMQERFAQSDDEAIGRNDIDVPLLCVYIIGPRGVSAPRRLASVCCDRISQPDLQVQI